MTTMAAREGDAVRSGRERERLRTLAVERFARSVDVPTRFFDAQGDTIARACLAMSRRFELGGRLLVFGVGAQATDARHVAVEFVHPVLVGKRALPAIALAPEGDGRDDPFCGMLGVIGGVHDIAMGIADDDGAGIVPALRRARRLGMLTLALAGADGESLPADFAFAVPTDDALVVQEVHEMLYHVLWELVHVFFDDRGAHA